MHPSFLKAPTLRKEAKVRKRTLRVIAILVCLSFITLLVPGATAADRKVKKLNFSITILKQSMLVFSSIFPFFTPIYDTGNDITLPNFTDNTARKIKITDSKGKPKPPDGGD